MAPVSDVLLNLAPHERETLLDVLTSPRRIRAEAIQRFFGQPEGKAVADVLIQLEVDDDARAEAISVLRDLNVAPAQAV